MTAPLAEGFLIVNGLVANTAMWRDIDTAREAIGYVLQDGYAGQR